MHNFRYYFFLFLSLTFGVTLLSCRGSLTHLPGGEEIEGWRTIEGEDYFFMRIGARASERAINKNDRAMMKATCIESTQLQAQDRIIRKMIGEYQESSSMALDAQTVAYVINSTRGALIRGTSVKECAPTDAKKEWMNCECIHYVKGRNLRQEFQFELEKAVGNH